MSSAAKRSSVSNAAGTTHERRRPTQSPRHRPRRTLGLSTREIAVAAQVTHSTIRSINNRYVKSEPHAEISDQQPSEHMDQPTPAEWNPPPEGKRMTHTDAHVLKPGGHVPIGSRVRPADCSHLTGSLPWHVMALLPARLGSAQLERSRTGAAHTGHPPGGGPDPRRLRSLGSDRCGRASRYGAGPCRATLLAARGSPRTDAPARVGHARAPRAPER